MPRAVGSVMIVETKRSVLLLRLVVVLWLLVSGAALIGMYKLWWTRERANYIGQTEREKREAIFVWAGLPLSSLDAAETADRAWPLDVKFQEPVGSAVELSYLKYLLIPRSVVDESEYKVHKHDGKFFIEPDLPLNEWMTRPLFSTRPPGPRGLLVSFFFLAGISLAIRHAGVSVAEGIAISSLVVWAVLFLAKGVSGSLSLYPALVLIAGSTGFVFAGMRACRGYRAGLQVADLWTTAEMKSHQVEAHSSAGQRPPIQSRILMLASMTVVSSSVAWSFLMSVVVGPDDWDAWAMWGAKAKIMAVDAARLVDVTLFAPGSADYPLLWPSVWAFSGWCAGGWEEQWGKGWGALFFLFTVMQVGLIAKVLSRRNEIAWFAAALVASMPAVPLIASWAYAEPLLWLMMICAYGRLLNWKNTGKTTDAFLAGLFAAGAALSKNEGILFFVLGLIWMLVPRVFRKWKGLAVYAAVSILLYAPWLLWIKTAASVDPGASLGAGARAWTDVLGRVSDSLPMIGGVWKDVKQWNIVVWGLGVMSLYYLVRKPLRFVLYAWVPVGMLAGSLAVIALRDGDLGWQVGTAWNRLTVQVAPMFVLALIACRFHADPPNPRRRGWKAVWRGSSSSSAGG